MLIIANLPKNFWGKAAIVAVYIYNLTLYSSLNYKTLFELKNNRKPIISYLRIFSSLVYFKNKGISSSNTTNNNTSSKLVIRGLKGILVGYTYTAHTYLVYNLNTKKFLYTRDIIILEGRYNTLSKNTLTSSINYPVSNPEQNSNNSDINTIELEENNPASSHYTITIISRNITPINSNTSSNITSNTNSNTIPNNILNNNNTCEDNYKDPN